MSRRFPVTLIRGANRERLKLETVSGNIAVSTDSYREFSASSVSGDISLRGKPLDDARADAETMSGDIRIDRAAISRRESRRKPSAGASAVISARSRNLSTAPGVHSTPASVMAAHRIQIDTFSGDISIRRD
ncbi:MAG: DUF4097 family beta strand repeat protein [Xanthomonadales bacterium]|nr:DUF4097 family beta strand repeat protein [Xanthomonadales bacterium]